MDKGPFEHVGVAEIDCNDMVVLDREECNRRLGRGGVGRVALVADGLPKIFPVNYAVADECIFFLTAPGSKLEAVISRTVMALEVDAVDPFEHGGWSVVATGGSSIVASSEAETVSGLKLRRWAGGGPQTLVRIRVEDVSGREIGRPGVKGWTPVS